jgi:hypothetical protein
MRNEAGHRNGQVSSRVSGEVSSRDPAIMRDEQWLTL